MAGGIFFPRLQLIALSAACVALVVVPLAAQRRIDWFASWNLVVYTILIGLFARSIYITFDIPDTESVERLFLLGKAKDVLLWPMLVILIGTAFMSLGYLAGPRRRSKLALRIVQSDDWNEKRLLLVVVIMLVFSWVGIFLFVERTAGEVLLDTISAKRGVARELTDYNAYGYLRWMATLSGLAFYLMVAVMVSRERVRFRYVMLLSIALCTSLFFNVFISARGSIVFLFINWLAISYYLKNKRLNVLKAALFLGIVLVSVRALSDLRRGADIDVTLLQRMNPVALIEPIILSRSLVDASKTAHIMAAVPTRLPYEWGGTLFTFLIAWIPRSVWSGKPVVNVDNIVGREVFGATSYGAGGVPAGIFAEMYWNFSYLGVVLGCFLAGILVKYTYNLFKACGRNKNIVLVYVICFMPLGASLLGSSVTPIIVGMLTSLVPLYVVLTYITRKPYREPISLKGTGVKEA